MLEINNARIQLSVLPGGKQCGLESRIYFVSDSAFKPFFFIGLNVIRQYLAEICTGLIADELKITGLVTKGDSHLSTSFRIGSSALA